MALFIYFIEGSYLAKPFPYQRSANLHKCSSYPPVALEERMIAIAWEGRPQTLGGGKVFFAQKAKV